VRVLATPITETGGMHNKGGHQAQQDFHHCGAVNLAKPKKSQ
jgi:hypothetical protein